MGLMKAIAAFASELRGKRTSDSSFDESLWGAGLWTVPTTSGARVNQVTALSSTVVLACVTILSEDFAKLTPHVYKGDRELGEREEAKDHPLYQLLYAPNDYQNWFEFAQMMQLSLCLRENAYAVIIRDGRGREKKLVPINADWCALWEAPDGQLFYRVTPNGLKMMSELQKEPFLIPSEDMFHLRGLSMNGLLGASKIILAKEAIGLSLAYEQQAGYWMNNSAGLSGVLQTDQKLSPEAAERLAGSWRANKAGLQNAGKIAVLEEGLKYNPISMNAEQAQFIASRQFQVADVARIFRIPLHMLGDLTRSTNNNISQQAQEYINLTLSSHTKRWAWKLDQIFDLRAQGLFIEFDLSELIRGDRTTRYANYARGISGGFLTPNEARIDDGKPPMDGGNQLLQPSNLSAAGSHASGDGADGGGRPPDGEEHVEGTGA